MIRSELLGQLAVRLGKTVIGTSRTLALLIRTILFDRNQWVSGSYPASSFANCARSRSKRLIQSFSSFSATEL